MKADLPIQALLEAAEVGDDRVWLEPKYDSYISDNGHRFHAFRIMHPVHGSIGYLEGSHDEMNGLFDVEYISFHKHPDYKNQENRSTHPDNHPDRMLGREVSLPLRSTHPNTVNRLLSASREISIAKGWKRAER